MITSANAWQPEDLETVDACPVCGNPASGEVVCKDVEDFWEGVPGRWRFQRCHGCRSLFLAERPRPEALHLAYRSYYTHVLPESTRSDESGRGVLWAIANDYLAGRYGDGERSPFLRGGRYLLPLLAPLRWQLDYFFRELPRQPGRLLDVGCGNGLFMLRARRAGWTVEGIEPDDSAAAMARGHGLSVHVATLDQVEELQPFDAITASHVVEHVYDPLAFLGQIHSALRPGGHVWLCTPNANSRGLAAYGRYWRGLEASRHLSVLSPDALVDLLQRAGFEDVRLRCRGRGARYILDESARYAAARGDTMARRPSALVTDILATLSPRLGEELVVTARRPA